MTAGPGACEACGMGRNCPGLSVCTRCLPGQLGITYRQLDWWSRQDYLRPVTAGGSGCPRVWPDAELEIARRMAKLTAAGISVPAAARFARDGWPDGEIAPGIRVGIREHPDETEAAS